MMLRSSPHKTLNGELNPHFHFGSLLACFRCPIRIQKLSSEFANKTVLHSKNTLALSEKGGHKP